MDVNRIKGFPALLTVLSLVSAVAFSAFADNVDNAAFSANGERVLEAVHAWQMKVNLLRQGGHDQTFVDKAMRVYNEKCVNSAGRDTCFITERDLYPEVGTDDDNNALIFRGEPTLPGQGLSPVILHILHGHSLLCKNLRNCKFSEVLDKINAQALILSKRADWQLGDDWKYDEAKGEWSRSTGVEKIDMSLNANPNPIFSFEGEHIIGKGHSFLISGTDQVASFFDPFLSYSLNPTIALAYSNAYRQIGKAATILVVSVPITDLPKADNCGDKMSALGQQMKISGCVTDDYGGEREVSTVLMTKLANLKDVIALSPF